MFLRILSLISMSSYISKVYLIAVEHFEKFFINSRKLNGEESLHPVQIKAERLTFHRPTLECISSTIRSLIKCTKAFDKRLFEVCFTN